MNYTDVSNIIYAQPCKSNTDIDFAKQSNIQTTVVDSLTEVEKLGKQEWKGNVWIRLLVPDNGSKQPFGKKFGAPLEWLTDMYKTGETYSLRMNGFSFHVGSECVKLDQYYTALEVTKRASKLAEIYGFKTEWVDIGGGFLPSESYIQSVAKQMKRGLSLFPNAQWVSEPGRFFAAPTHTLYVPIIGKKPSWPKSDRSVWRYTLDESVYGMFSNIPFDCQTPQLKSERNTPVYPSTVFGRTCDSADCIADSVLLPELEIGDILSVTDMGAYTFVSSSEFNGFPKPRKVYLE